MASKDQDETLPASSNLDALPRYRLEYLLDDDGEEVTIIDPSLEDNYTKWITVEERYAVPFEDWR